MMVVFIICLFLQWSDSVPINNAFPCLVALHEITNIPQ